MSEYIQYINMNYDELYPSHRGISLKRVSFGHNNSQSVIQQPSSFQEPIYKSPQS